MINSVAVAWKFPKCIIPPYKVTGVRGVCGGNENRGKIFYFKIIYLQIIGMKTGLYF